MKRSLLLLCFIGYLNFCNAQAGLLDRTFGKEGIVASDLGSVVNKSRIGKQILIQSDTALYFISVSEHIAHITKKHINGSPDLNYGLNGNSTPVAISVTQAALQSDGKIIVVGYITILTQQYDANHLTIARFNTDGSLDTTFNKVGKTIVGYSDNTFATSIAIQKNGKIIVGGYTYSSQTYSGFYSILYCFNPDGTIDEPFTLNANSVEYGTIVKYNSIAIQEDGKILAAGFKYDGNNYIMALIRHNINGSIDSSFPVKIYPLKNVDFDINHELYITILHNNKIIVAGSINKDFALASFSKEGIFESLQTTDFDSGDDIVSALTINKNGEIILAGNSHNDKFTSFSIAKYHTDLQPDKNFSEDGKITTEINTDKKYLNAVATEPNGKILAVGFTIDGNDSNSVALKFTADGTPDNSFGINGKLIEKVLQGSTKYTSIALQKDGKVIAGGTTMLNSNSTFALVRYKINGALDETFANGGKQINNFGNTNSYLNAITIQSDGKILAGGSIDNSFALVRYNQDGSLDKTFGTNGVKKHRFSDSNYINSIIVQPDGKIVAGGSALARFKSDGRLDSSFSESGVLIPYYPFNRVFNCVAIDQQKNGEILILNSYGYQTPDLLKYLKNGQLDSSFGENGHLPVYSLGGGQGTTMSLQNDGKIVVGGFIEQVWRLTNSSFSILRLHNDGKPDLTFNGGQIVQTYITSRSYGKSLKIQEDNKIIFAGYANTEEGRDVFTIVRYNADGSLDNTFNNKGMVTTPASGANSRIESISIFNNNLYAAGYGQYPGDFGVVAKYSLCENPEISPMKVLNFKGDIKNKKVPLSWQLENEKNLKGFILERSADSIHFVALNYIAGKGNNQLKMDFSTEDIQPLKGINYYRLKMLEKNTAFTYSNLISIELKDENITLKVYPNPAKNRLLIMTPGENENATLQIIDNNGIKIKEVKTTLNGATFIDVNLLAAGTYHLKIITKADSRILKFIKE